MNNLYIGIDPGITGAIAALNDGEDREDGIPFIVDTPVYTKKNKKQEFDFYKMFKLLGNFAGEYRVYLTLERQQAMPKQGVSSTFKTGRGYGAWEALCWATTPDFQIVSPRIWKKALGLTNDKEVSRLKAISLYPGLEHMLKRKKDHNRAEALLLAHYTKLKTTIHK